jgi:hypothetical protein
MMFSLPVERLRLYVWLVLGLLIYYFYGQRNGKLRLCARQLHAVEAHAGTVGPFGPHQRRWAISDKEVA